MAHKIEVKGQLSGYGTKVYLDGKELHGVRLLTFSVGIDRVTTALIEILADVEIESEAEVEIRGEIDANNRIDNENDKI